MATTTWKQGTITLTNGSATVTGDGTDWDVADLEGGETLAVVTDPPIDFSMTIQAVVGAEEITLTAPWAGATLIDVPYQITRDYTGAPADAPIPQRGDMNPWAIIGEAFRRLNNAISAVASMVTNFSWGGIGGTLSDQTDLQSALDAKLDDPGSNGIAARTGANGASVARTITGTANQVMVANGDGVSGNPTLSLPQNIHTGATPTFSTMSLSGGDILVSGALAAQVRMSDTGAGTDMKHFQFVTNDGVFIFRSRTDANAALMTVLEMSHQDGWVRPGTNGSQDLGQAARRWKEIFAANGTINTSDAREKTAVRAMSEEERAAASDLAREIGVFQFLAAIAQKGESNARWHIGMTVQRAIEIMESHALDPMKYGFICYDEWDEWIEEIPAITETHPAIFDEEGAEIEPERVEIICEAETIVHPAGTSFGFRADQLLLFMMRGMAAEADAAKARMDDLESRLSALEGSA